ncbi:MAG TPA: hypothetical protein VGO51_13125 [Burkholderiaceae bacterium]|nr:hypothetical protein [Burkholderiaceae bacterium]
MQIFDALLLRINDLDHIPAFRIELVLLIFQNLCLLRDSLDQWEKCYFWHAINSLARNVNSVQQPTTAWLRLCLIDLEKALMPKEERNDRYCRPGAKADAVNQSYEQLMATLDCIGQKIGLLPHDWTLEKQYRET